MSTQGDNARLWRVDVLGGVELLRALYVEFSFSPHTHEEFMIAVTESGTALPRTRQGTHPVGPGDVLALNPGEVHGGGPAPGSIWRYRAFYLPADLVKRAVHEVTRTIRTDPEFSRKVVRDRHMATMLRRAHMALEEPNSVLERESLLLEALARLISFHGTYKLPAQPVDPSHRAVARAREYLEVHPGENVTLENLAREAGVSRFHLCRVFRQATGLPPHAYQTLARVRLAKARIAEGVPISQAALDSGFCDQAHLTRHFRRIFGVTPGRYLARTDRTAH